jgi:rod shape determining protein RodA
MLRQYFQELRDFFRKGDMVLLLLCLLTTAFGCLVIASTTNYTGSIRYVVVQVGAALIGVFLFAIVSSIDADFFSEHRYLLIAFNCLLLLMIVPFGTDNGTGNKSWLDFSFLPVDIQPAEICKIAFVLILASVMASHQNRISSFPSVLHMAFHLILLVGLNMYVSRDLGVSLIFIFIFIGMTFAGGVSMIWYLVTAGGLVALAPAIWNFVLSGYQRNRIEVLFNPNLDPNGTGARYHTVRSLRSLTGGGLLGQGLFQGTRTQTPEALYAQHTDYIFSAIGEELGYVGCALTIILLVLIIARCIWVGNRSQDYMRRLICFGVSAALIFQVISNVGMCMGITPVIGLTLPFISYGGSSLVSLFAMLGLVSGVYARPSPASHERYIRPPLKSIRYH